MPNRRRIVGTITAPIIMVLSTPDLTATQPSPDATRKTAIPVIPLSRKLSRKRYAPRMMFIFEKSIEPILAIFFRRK